MDRKLEASGRKLSNPFVEKWMKLAAEDEKKLLSIIERIFGKYKRCMRTVKKPPKWDRDKQVNSLTEEELKQKNMFKSWFVIGTNKILRSLEKGELCLVLRKADLQGVVTDMILSLAVSHQCPAICVSELLTSIQAGWPDMTSVSVFAIKSLTEPNDFSELMQFVQGVLPVPDKVDGLPQEKGNISVTKENKTGKIPPLTPNTDEAATNVADSNKETSENEEMDQSHITLEPSPSVIKLHDDDDVQDETVEAVTVDPTKYYVYRSQLPSRKTFGGEDFIAFGEDLATDKHVYVVNGKVSVRSQEGYNKELYGIAPSFSGTDDEQRRAPPKNKKRALDVTSSYRGITIKQAKRDLTSARQKKKERKRQTNAKKKGRVKKNSAK